MVWQQKLAVDLDVRNFKYFADASSTYIDLYVLKQNGLLLKHVKNQRADKCLVAVNQNWKAVKHVKKLTPKLCTTMLKQASTSKIELQLFLFFQEKFFKQKWQKFLTRVSKTILLKKIYH